MLTGLRSPRIVRAFLILTVIGCGKRTEQAADTSYSSAAVPTPPPAIDSPARGSRTSYDRLYIAKTETEWSTNPASPTPPTTGPIAKGDTVYFNREPNTAASWQDAKVKKLNLVRFVRPNAFTKAGS